ncbi:hypothetical protein, partial [Streptomyces sp. WM6386]|uniref:hypothetical protein n=1 Tax=Streptomyces sp. WM6386 TaxID=1415558 RepID=UPI001F3689F6
GGGSTAWRRRSINHKPAANSQSTRTPTHTERRLPARTCKMETDRFTMTGNRSVFAEEAGKRTLNFGDHGLHQSAGSAFFTVQLPQIEEDIDNECKFAEEVLRPEYV